MQRERHGAARSRIHLPSRESTTREPPHATLPSAVAAHLSPGPGRDHPRTKPVPRMHREQTGSNAPLLYQFLYGKFLGSIDVLSDVLDVIENLRQSHLATRWRDNGCEFSPFGYPDLLACAGAFDQFGQLLLGFKESNGFHS